MALGGAWVRTQVGVNTIQFVGRTASADADAMILGLDGDVGADTGFTTPAGFPVSTTETPLSDADRHLRTTVEVIAQTDNGLAAGGAGVGIHIVDGSAPWRKTIAMNGTPNAAVTFKVVVRYLHSAIR
mgnify:CR=1 FL=1